VKDFKELKVWGERMNWRWLCISWRVAFLKRSCMG